MLRGKAKEWAVMGSLGQSGLVLDHVWFKDQCRYITDTKCVHCKFGKMVYLFLSPMHRDSQTVKH